jgi:mannose-6-phosphate isomerase-like protein (cupin superfamily)
MISTEKQIVVPKGWGSETWITNNELFCGKILKFNQSKSFSWHYHKLKTEVFYVQKGEIKLFYSWQDNINKAESCVLKTGDSFEVPVGLRHKIYAIKKSVIFEFSTTHFDDDSYRLLKGD